MNTALLIVDIQNDYFPGGKMELADPISASLKAKEILEFFRSEKMPVIHVQHLSTYPGASFFIPDTEGVAIHNNVLPRSFEKVIQKNFPNSFRGTDLLDYLSINKIKKIVICGMMTHMCIDATARAAFDYGFQNIIIKDACATKALVFENAKIPADIVHHSFLAALDNIYGKVLSAGEAIDHMKR
jgi:nicotinamidase-related amidase